MCIIEDFNASNNNMFGSLLNFFCQNLNLTMSDEAMLPKKFFMYVSDAHNTCSWIDHCMSCAAHTSITKIEVLHNFNTSDHHPLSITFYCKFFTQIAVDEPVPDYFNVKWSKVSQTNKANYHEATKYYLNNIFLPFEVIKYNDAHCCDQKHLELINKFYSDIVCSLLQPSKDVLGSSCHHRSFHPIPGWNDSVKFAHIRARTSYLSWVKKGRPKNDEILTRMISARKQFKYELRRCKD